MSAKKSIVKIGKASFNVEAVSKMKEDEFVKAHKHLRNAKEIYKQIVK